LELEILYKRAIEGDSRSENELFRRLSVSFRVIAQRRVWDEYQAEEVVQEALLAVAQKYRSLEINNSIAGWAHNVLNNKIMDYVKSKKTARGSARVKTLGESDGSCPEPDPMLKSRLLVCLRKISRANDRFARILNFKYLGYSTEEVCKKLGIERNNFYVILSRARSLLELCLNKGKLR
jgi:RNA polymerase sigma-70 factor (ECF subfamily)